MEDRRRLGLEEPSMSKRISDALWELTPRKKARLEVTQMQDTSRDDEPLVHFPDGSKFSLESVQKVCLEDTSLQKHLSDLNLDWLDFPQSLSGSSAQYSHRENPAFLQSVHRLRGELWRIAEDHIADPELRELIAREPQQSDAVVAVLGCFARAIIDSIEQYGLGIATRLSEHDGCLQCGEREFRLSELLLNEARHGSSAQLSLTEALAKIAVESLFEGRSIIPGITSSHTGRAGVRVEVDPSADW